MKLKNIIETRAVKYVNESLVTPLVINYSTYKDFTSNPCRTKIHTKRKRRLDVKG